MLHDQITTIVATYGYAALALIIALESAGLPLPGETTLVSAAIYAGETQGLSIGWILVAAAAGAIIGDNLGYLVGRRFGYALLLQHGRRVGLTDRRLKVGHYLFHFHGGKIVFFGRFVALLRAAAALLAGANRMEWRSFIVANVAGGVAWAAVFGLGGYFFGQQIHDVLGPLGIAMLVAAVIGAGVAALVMRKFERRLEDRAEAAFPGDLRAVRQGDAGPPMSAKIP